MTLDPSTIARYDSASGSGSPSGRRSMPDIARRQAASLGGTLDRVGMRHIEMPARVPTPAGDVQIVPAVADAFVSLDDEGAKGIHMSRLFLGLQQALEWEDCTLATLKRVVEGFLVSHQGLSKRASVRVRFEVMRKRTALVSDNSGWRSYPVELGATCDAGRWRFTTRVAVTYSSTCPCSAALARQLIQESFDATFEAGQALDPAEVRAWLGTADAICATPHSQRSTATVDVAFTDPSHAVGVDALIDGIEGALATVVQAAVKREDEQAFALLNGQNLMFCEDAARRMKSFLELDARVADYRAEASHMESLHPHDAVAIVTKGVEGGFQP